MTAGDTGAPIGATPIFQDGFENATTFEDLFPPDRSRWTLAGLTVAGNTLELSQQYANTGTQSLRCYAEPYDGVTGSKAYVSITSLPFVDGDEAWFELWVRVQGPGSPDLFLWDLEANATCSTIADCPEEGAGTLCLSPGRRLYLQNSNGTPIRSDLGKWCLGKTFAQDIHTAVPFPTDQWVRLRIFIGLSSQPEGYMQVWQDDNLILNHRGYTLPRSDSNYNSIQVGITANGGEISPATVYLDDVTIWDSPPAWWLAIFDRNADGELTVGDAHELHRNVADLNNDSVIDRADIDLLEWTLRWDEPRDKRVEE